jgi:multiple sugar transport system permease protein
MIFVVIATTIAAFSLFTQVDVMTQGGPNDATATLIYHAIRSGFREQDVAYGATVAVIYFFLVLGVALVQRRLTASAEERQGRAR